MLPQELEILLAGSESDRVEFKESLGDKDKICQAICAFANDMPNHGRPGYVFVGVDDAGQPVGVGITDQLLTTLAAIRDDGNIQPLPTMNVDEHEFIASRSVTRADCSDRSRQRTSVRSATVGTHKSPRR